MGTPAEVSMELILLFYIAKVRVKYSPGISYLF